MTAIATRINNEVLLASEMDETKLGSVDYLIEALKSANSLMKSAVCRMAVACARLDELGKLPDGLSPQVISTLKRIAYGQCLPDIFASYTTRPRLMGALSQLPLPEQIELTERGTVKVVCGKSYRMIPLDALTPDQMKQVLNTREGRLNTEAEQRSIIEARNEKARIKSRPAVTQSYEVNKRQHTVTFLEAGQSFTKEQIVKILSELI